MATTSLAPAPSRGFSLETFAPGWGALVMGTSALAVAVQAAGEGTAAETAATVVARILLVLVLLGGLVIIGLTAARWLRHTDAALDDLRHPVKGGMTATAAGGLLTIAVALGRVGPGFLPAGVIVPVVAALTVVGTVLALIIGWEFLGQIFVSDGVALPQISGAWFIPPVVTIIVPLAMLPLIAEFDSISGDLLAIAWGFLGVGSMLYVLVAATLFLRSVSHPLPPAALAPTLIIGMGPAGLIGLDLVRLAQTGAQAGVGPADQVAFAALPATMMWGFGAWWLVSALMVLRRGYDALPFGLSWWGFTFPVAAWTLSTIVLGRVWGAAWLDWFGIAAVVLLLVLWLYVLVRTVVGIRRGTIWSH